MGTGRDRKETEVRSCQGVRTDVLHSHYWMFAFWNPSRLSVCCVIALHIYIYIWGGGYSFFFFFFFLVRVCI